MSDLRVFFVVNPQSAGGSTGKQWDVSIKKQIVGRFPNARWAFTAAGGQAARQAEAGWKAGAELVVAVGGDGTANEVINGLMGELLDDGQVGLPGAQGASWPAQVGVPPRPMMGILPRGTGCDLARSLGMPKDLNRALEILANGATVDADVGEIQFTRSGGGQGRRFFINIASAGIAGDVVNRVNQSSKQLGGFLSFLGATLASNVAYEAPKVTVSADGGPAQEVDLRVMFVCNAQFCGGGMRVGRGAQINDGSFKVVEIADPGFFKALLQGGNLYSGKFEGMKEARVYEAKRLEVSSSVPVLVECDGEQPGILPATYTTLESIIRLRMAPDALVIQG